LSPAGENGRLSILIFHRVLRQVDPLFPEEMHAQRFDAPCAPGSNSWFNVLPLDEAVRRLKNRQPARNVPWPSLSTTATPTTTMWLCPSCSGTVCASTFFIATGFLGGGRMWNDTVIESVRRTNLAARCQCRRGPWPGLADTLDTSAASARAARSHRPRSFAAIKYLPVAAALAAHHTELAEVAQVTPPTDFMMTRAQVRAMRKRGYADWGAHGVSSDPRQIGCRHRAHVRKFKPASSNLEDVLDEPVTLVRLSQRQTG
jgi:hypothetical protein